MGLLAGFLMSLPVQAQSLAPTVSNVTSNSFTISWTTSQPLNTQVLYGTSSPSIALHSWSLSTGHTMTVSGLQPGTAYKVEALSTYYTTTEESSPVLNVTTLGGTTGSGSSTGATNSGLGTPAISNISSTGFTISWQTTQPLNTQVHFGVGSMSGAVHNWTLATNHSIAVTGLQPGATYNVQAESSYFTNPDLLGPVQTVTTLGGTNTGSGSGSGSGTGSTTPTLSTPVVSNVTPYSFTLSWSSSVPLNSVVRYGVNGLTSTATNASLVTAHSVTVSNLQANTAYQVEAQSSSSTVAALNGPLQTVTTANAASSNPPSSRLFTNSAADWLYSPPTGTGINISTTTSNITFHVNTHDGGFDYPVQYTDGTHGCTNFNDTGHWNFNDHYCVPNPANGFYPSVGGWGANDGHLVVVDTKNNVYYDFWQLLANGKGTPTSANVGQITEGSLNGNGTPGTTAAVITGLAGDILPGELNCSTCLQHALNVVVPGAMNSNLVGHQAPAQKTDGSHSGAIFREGAKIRFDPSINVDSLPVSTAVKAIMKALQNYGGVITDQTGGTGISFYSSLPSQPDLTGINLIGQHLLIYY